MDEQKLGFFYNCMADAFQKVALNMSGTKFTPVDAPSIDDKKKFLLIVGIVGMNKGRILIEMNDVLAFKIFEQMNGSPPDNDLDLYLYLAEFANIVSGNGITTINNAIKGCELRLTPPTVFAGEDLEITSPKVNSVVGSYRSEYGTVKLEIGVEGV